jgi:hypothetical protein
MARRAAAVGAFLTLGTLGAAIAPSQAKPPDWAPAHGYRRKVDQDNDHRRHEWRGNDSNHERDGKWWRHHNDQERKQWQHRRDQERKQWRHRNEQRQRQLQHQRDQDRRQWRHHRNTTSNDWFRRHNLSSNGAWRNWTSRPGDPWLRQHNLTRSEWQSWRNSHPVQRSSWEHRRVVTPPVAWQRTYSQTHGWPEFSGQTRSQWLQAQRQRYQNAIGGF